MPVKGKSRKLNSLSAHQTANIPTTIKNPERVAHRRTELIEVATKLFLERGFHNTSIRDIVRACSFNIASLYMYVSSKEDILYLVAQDLMNNIARELNETVLPGPAREALEHGFASYCRIVDRLRRPIRLLYREVAFLPDEPRSNVLGTVSDVVSFFEKIIKQGMASGEFRDSQPSRLIALDMMFMAHVLALHTREVRKLVSLERYIDSQVETIFAGLLAQPNSPKKKSSANVVKLR